MKKQCELRDYQIPVVKQALEHSEGMIVMSTGSGKSYVACEIIYQLGLTATILVPKTDLLRQFEKTLWEGYKYKAGIIGDGQKEIKQITIATYQSLHNDPETLGLLASRTSVLIVDECQEGVSDLRMQIIKRFRPSRMYGLTATPKRSKDDGKSDAVGFIFGDIIANYESKTLKPTVCVIQTGNSGVHIPTDDYPIIIENMVANETRNRLIASIATAEMLSGKKVLILTKRVAHYERLQELLIASDGIIGISSKDKDKNALLERLRGGTQPFNILLGTTSLLAVGTDIPILDTLILACDMKSDVLAVQASGRILRLFEGKTSPVIYDFWDDKNGILNNQFKQRLAVWKMKGWEVDMHPQIAWKDLNEKPD